MNAMSLVGSNKHIPAKEALREALRSCRGAFIAISIFSFVVNLFILTLPLYMFSVFDRVLTSYSMATLFALFSMACFALFIQMLVDIARSKVLIEVGNFLDKRLSTRLLHASVAASAKRGNSKGIGPVQDFNMIKMFLTSQSIFNIMDAPWIPIFLAVLAIMNPMVGVVASIGAVGLFLLALLNDRWGKKPMEDANRVFNRAQRVGTTAARNADVVESMGMTATIVSLWDKQARDAIVHQTTASERAAIIGALSKMFRMVVQISVMTVAAMSMITPGSTATPGLLMASVILVGRALMPLESLIGQYNLVWEAVGTYRRINKTLAEMEERPRLSVYPEQPTGRIEVEGVTYALPSLDRPILNNISFTVEPGEVIGVIGPSAAGKTSLATLLVGLEKPTSGHIRMDGTDVYAWPSEHLGQFVGYLPQTVELFDGTIRDNICRLREDATNEQVVEAARKAGLHEIIQRFAAEYDTDVGAGGGRLSGGQRQRVGLARALFGSPRLVVLDEPNSNLDSQGEAALRDTLNALREQGTTVFVIAHRINILQHVDKVLAMSNGVIQKFADRDKVITAVPDKPRVAADNRKAIEGKAGDGQNGEPKGRAAS